MRHRDFHYVYVAAALLLTACADHWDDFTPSKPTEENTEQGFAFSASVQSSQLETRADGSLINRLETSLFETKDRSYYVLNSETGEVEELQKQYSVGIFGAYTGGHTWHELLQQATKTEAEVDALTEEQQKERTTLLNTFYSANLFYNQKADIEAYKNGTNALTYSPLRFWPNNVLTTTDGEGHTVPVTDSDGQKQHERATFWAYYPYNPTEDPGEYGISITSGTMGKGMGGGSIGFTMHPDAAEQNDFMLSDIVADCNRDEYPLTSESEGGISPKSVPFRFHHMLAQVRIYAFIRGTDKVVYLTTGTDAEGAPIYVTATAKNEADGLQIVNEYGEPRAVKAGERLPDDTGWAPGYDASKVQTQRWERYDGQNGNDEIWDVTHSRLRAKMDYVLSFNNIHTSCIYTPHVTYNEVTRQYETSLTTRDVDYTDVGTLGSATVNHYIMNPYWFRYKDGERVMLNENYMFDYFEDTPAANGERSEENYDGWDWSTFKDEDGKIVKNPLGYDITDDGTGYDKEIADPDDARGHQGWHFNYAPGNIILAVPQVMNDDDVPNIVIETKAKEVKWTYNSSTQKWTRTTESSTLTARVTVNMLQMNLKWEPGFIYCYAFLDDLMPGDDKVQGPENITSVFKPTDRTDQW